MHEIIQQLLYFFGHGFCHQIADRSFTAGGFYFSVCSRDTGIYMGLFISVCVICLIYRSWEKRPSALPPWPLTISAVVCFLPMAVDGVTSYLHLRETDNTIRFFTGYGAGMAVGIFAATVVMDMTMKGTEALKVLATRREILCFFATNIVCSVMFFFLHSYLGILAPVLVVLVFLSIAISVNAVVLNAVLDAQNPHLLHRYLSRRLVFFTTCVILALAEIAFVGWLRDLVFLGHLDLGLRLQV